MVYRYGRSTFLPIQDPSRETDKIAIEFLEKIDLPAFGRLLLNSMFTDTIIGLCRFSLVIRMKLEMELEAARASELSPEEKRLVEEIAARLKDQSD